MGGAFEDVFFERFYGWEMDVAGVAGVFVDMRCDWK